MHGTQWRHGACACAARCACGRGERLHLHLQLHLHLRRTAPEEAHPTMRVEQGGTRVATVAARVAIGGQSSLHGCCRQHTGGWEALFTRHPSHHTALPTVAAAPRCPMPHC